MAKKNPAAEALGKLAALKRKRKAEPSTGADAPLPSPDPEAAKNPAAVAMGKLGGRKGGKARAAKLTPERRSEIARAAGIASWKNRR